jgi:hypothetical protein
MKFEIFERLNTGGLALNAQEVRNAIYHGRFNNLLKDLESYKGFLACLGLSRPRKRMVDRELVLRLTRASGSPLVVAEPGLPVLAAGTHARSDVIARAALVIQSSKPSSSSTYSTMRPRRASCISMNARHAVACASVMPHARPNSVVMHITKETS